MSAQLAEPAAKPRSDSTLKTKSDALQEEIVKESRTKSCKELADWLAKEKQIQTSASAVCRFLGWFRTNRQGTGNEGSKEALQDLNKSPAEFFQDTMLDQQNLTAWHQSQRIAVRREELEIQREELKLKQKVYERSTAEWAVATFTNPKLKSIAQDGTKTYAERIDEAQTFMFGEEEQPKGVEALNGGTVEAGKGGTEIPNIQHPIEGEKGAEANLQQPTSNIQHQENGAEAPTAKLQAPENNQTPNIPASSIQHLESSIVGDESSQPTDHPQLSPAAGSMSPGDAQSFVENLYHKVKQKGLGIIINRWDLAALTACLSGQPAKWHSSQAWDLETMEPPAIDPRINPESPWYDVWPEYVKGALL